MNIAIFDTMPLDSFYTGVHGVTGFWYPLIKRFKADKHKIYFFGKEVVNKKRNIFCDVMGIKPIVHSIHDDVEKCCWDYDKLDKCDFAIVYNRPSTAKDEFKQMNMFIKYALKLGMPVYYVMGDLWMSMKHYMHDMILLRPFESTDYDSHFKKAFHFEYTRNDLITSAMLDHRDRPIDHVYIGNVYNRFDEFKEKFEQLDGNIIVAGSWIRDKERWDKSLQLKNVHYIGEIPHCYCIPLLALAKNTYYIIPKHYQRVGMKTLRIYEASKANCNIDVEHSKLPCTDDAYKLFWEIYDRTSK